MKKIVSISLKLIGPIILIVIILSADLNAIYSQMKNMQFLFLVYCSLLLICLYLLKALRWKYLLEIQGIRYPISQSLLVILAANFIAFITPGRFGEIVKTIYLKNDRDIPFTKSTPTVIIDRLYDVYLLLLTGFSGIIYFSLWNPFRTFSYVLIMLIVLFHLIIFNRKGILFAADRLLSIQFLKKNKEKWIKILNHFFDEIRILLGIRLIPGFFMTLAAYLALFTIGYLINYYFQLNLNYLTVIFFISIANILSFLPISVSGIGTREAALIFLFSQIDKSKEEALVFSMFLFLIFYILGGLFCFIGYSIKPLHFNKLSQNKKRT